MEICNEMIEDDELMQVNGGLILSGDCNTNNEGDKNGEDDDQNPRDFVSNSHGMIMIQQ